MNIKNENLSHAHIIASLNETAKEEQATRLALSFICNSKKDGEPCMKCLECKRVLKKVHPDVIYLKRLLDDKGKAKKDITVEQIRTLGLDIYTMPQQAEKKVYIIEEGECMNRSAQNAALKILEEPPAHVVFIIKTDVAEKLLPTIRSRCTIRTILAEEEKLDSPLGKEFIDLCAKGDALKLCAFLVENEGLSQEELSEFLSAVHSYLMDILAYRTKENGLSREKTRELINLCEKAQKYLGFNVSPKHILGLISAEAI